MDVPALDSQTMRMRNWCPLPYYRCEHTSSTRFLPELTSESEGRRAADISQAPLLPNFLNQIYIIN